MAEKEGQRTKGLWGLPSLPLRVPTHQKIASVDKRSSAWWMLGSPPASPLQPHSLPAGNSDQASRCLHLLLQWREACVCPTPGSPPIAPSRPSRVARQVTESNSTAGAGGYYPSSYTKLLTTYLIYPALSTDLWSQ